MSPFEILFGRKMGLLVDLLFDQKLGDVDLSDEEVCGKYILNITFIHIIENYTLMLFLFLFPPSLMHWKINWKLMKQPRKSSSRLLLLSDKQYSTRSLRILKKNNLSRRPIMTSDMHMVNL